MPCVSARTRCPSAPACPLPPCRSLEHDIGGAQAAGVASVFVLGGIHAEDVQLAAVEGEGQQQQAAGTAAAGGHAWSQQRLAAVCEEHGAAPTFVLPYFRY